MLQDKHGPIDYSEQGAGPTIVLVPVSWSSESAWRDIVAGLRNRFRTVTTSLPGYGGTRESRTSSDSSVDRQSETVEAVIRHTGGPVHLVGHSYGALVCLDLALCGLVPLMSLTLIEPVAFGLLRQAGEQTLYEQFIAMRDDYVRAYENGDKEAARRMVDYLAGRGSFDALPSRGRQYVVDATPTHIRDMRSGFDPSMGSLANILLPSLIIRGEHGAEPLAKSADILSRAMANASLRTIAGASHFMPTTHAAELARLIGDHVLMTESLAWSSLSFASPFGPGFRNPAGSVS
ncbi:alpha/beta fold hydrolase [Bradyrhizobium sp. CCBAU 51753]|uniref:alpha/beta fold hydrolase n=1 Tax=Bradyrhizobium sp. CCBAU 51753 TaxID=1325100 RepID=UPI00188CCE6A|nr:alpha/beta hydrolase [Bradyrhizobium sp. CCBAU 51753]QOZ26618.1 alpha/beta hydrolase [Bradyrhizobium sp. CCBAU 51753]